MKQCPTCLQNYDDTEMFCQNDGIALVIFDSSEETVVVQNPNFNRQLYPNQVKAQSKNPMMYLMFGVILLLSVLVVGFGVAFFYEKNKDKKTEKAGNKTTEKANEQKPLELADKKLNNVTNPQVVSSIPTVNNEQLSNEVTERIYLWKKLSESRDVNAYMNMYAETVDYYQKSGANKNFIRNDKQRAFSKFDSVKINIGNINITSDSSGENATALIDKEWVFQGESYLAGKVRQQIRFRKINGEWLINGEKDLKVFYLNK
jgi:ketosteroid isomerase-like protein